MKQIFPIWAATLAAFVIGLAPVVSGVAAPPDSTETLSWLHTNGPRIINEQGKQVVLGGPNLGGYLVEEMWMMPFETKLPEGWKLGPAKDHVTLWRVIEKRFGAAEMQRIRTAQRDAWIGDGDFDRIHAAGLNCVRLPFTYDLLEEPDGFAWIDRTLERARKRGIYVILDLHGVPGRQSNSDHTGESGIDQFFKDPTNLDRTVAVWTTLAKRYKDHPEVAGYDLINEPMSAPDATTLYIMQDRLYRTIRAVDPRHLIFIEDGYKGRTSFPHPALVGWKNVVLSWHHYNFNAKSEGDQAEGMVRAAADAAREQRALQAPFYIGEFQLEPHGTPATLETGLRGFQENGVSWSNWTYKAVMPGGGGGMWGWVHSEKPVPTLDPYRDSAADLLRKIAVMRTENLTENTAMTAAFRTVVAVGVLSPLGEILPTGQTNATIRWRYTFDRPAMDWATPAFDASGWAEGSAGFGNEAVPPEVSRTPWKTADIWLRREWTLSEAELAGISHLRLSVSHDDDAEVYINGVLAAPLPGYSHEYAEVEIRKEALTALRPGENILAIHCHQTVGGQFIDAGILGLRQVK